jgi:hypothetical protein
MAARTPSIGIALAVALVLPATGQRLTEDAI